MSEALGWRALQGSAATAEIEACFAEDVAGGWPDGLAAVALLGFVDPLATTFHVMGYSPEGSVLVADDSWVSAETRGAVLALGAAALGGEQGTACVLATCRRSDGVWETRVEASGRPGKWDIGLVEAAMMAQEINPLPKASRGRGLFRRRR